MSEERLISQTERGRKAEILIKDELLVEAFGELKKEFISAWQETKLGQTEERERLYNLCQSLDALKQYLENIVQNGRFADNQLNEIRGKK